MIHVFQQQKDNRQIHNPTHLFTTQTCKSWSYNVLVLFLLAYNQAPSHSAKKNTFGAGFCGPDSPPQRLFLIEELVVFQSNQIGTISKRVCVFLRFLGDSIVFIFISLYESYLFFWVLLSKWATERGFPSRWRANEQLDGGWVLANCWFFRNTLTLSNLCSIWLWNLVLPFFTPRKGLMGGKTCIKRLRHADGYSDLGASQYVWYFSQCSCRKYSNLTYASSTTNYIQLLYQVSTIFYVFTYT